MGLAETARALREQTISPEYQFLREARRLGEQVYTEKAVEAKLLELMAFEETPESLTPEGYAKRCRMIAEANEWDDLGKEYRKIVAAAEVSERREKGGAEKELKLCWGEINKRLDAIKEKWRAQKNFQVSLEDVRKDGGADGRND